MPMPMRTRMRMRMRMRTRMPTPTPTPTATGTTLTAMDTPLKATAMTSTRRFTRKRILRWHRQHCDGEIDTEFWDAYEPNELLTTAHDLGELDEDGWWWTSTSSVVIENLNLDNPFDEDWFTWNADDTWYDDPTSPCLSRAASTTTSSSRSGSRSGSSHPLASKEGWESSPSPKMTSPSMMDGSGTHRGTTGT